MQNLRLCVTESDISSAEKLKIRNPILFALQCVTGTLWRVQSEGVLQEAMAPYRVCTLSTDALVCWQEYSQTGRMAPCEIELTFSDGEAGPPTLAGSFLNQTLLESGKSGSR